ncbi:MAG: DUF4838 domain-containing protein [Lentisphaeria bacterium]|nr:DUF4838 domain-containing protein [Lentisphaeria bacterium]
MKKQINMITAGVLALSITTGCQSTQKDCTNFPDGGLTLVKNGKPAATILVNAPIANEGIPLRERQSEKLSRDVLAQRVLRTAVDDLNYHLKAMTGTTLPVAYNTNLKTPVLVLEIKNDAAQDEFFISCTQDKAVISGKDGFAIAHGIYELLSRQGCDWVFPGPAGEVIPKRATVSTGVFNYTSKPDFAVRCPWYPDNGSRSKHSPAELRNFNMWKLRHKLQLTRYNHPLVMIGGHVSDALIRKYQKLFDKNPDMYALVRNVDGSFTRRGPQLETTNPKVIKMIENYIRDIFKKRNWPKDKKVCIGVGPADGGGYSESIESQMASSGRLDPATGNKDFTDLQILLCNTLLERMEKEFPNLHLGFYLYSNHADYPVRYKPHPKIVLVIADISYSRLHGTLETQSKTRNYYRTILEKWKDSPNVKFFRGYNWNLAENVLPYSKLIMWENDLPLYKSLNVQGVYNETTKGVSNLAIGNYMEAKMLWDTKLKWRDVLHTFCRNAYGKAAAPMEKYFMEVTLRQSKSGQEAGSFHAFRKIYDQKFVDQARKWFARAYDLAENAAVKERIRIAELSLSTLEDHLKFKNAFNNFEFDKAKELFDKIMGDLKVEIDKRKNIVSPGGYNYFRRFHQDSVMLAYKYSQPPYSIAYKIPDKLKTMFDQFNSGNLMNYYGKAINDTECIKTATFSTTWDAQGLMGFRSGSVWYRITFPKLNSKSAGLFVGGADNIVRVWCNEKYIGMGRGFARPFTYDLTGLLNEDGDNLLVIQVQRRGNSEIGTGGIVYPCFIFTGPQLEKRAPDGELEYRLLPGGAIEKIKK